MSIMFLAIGIGLKSGLAGQKKNGKALLRSIENIIRRRKNAGLGFLPVQWMHISFLDFIYKYSVFFNGINEIASLSIACFFGNKKVGCLRGKELTTILSIRKLTFSLSN